MHLPVFGTLRCYGLFRSNRFPRIRMKAAYSEFFFLSFEANRRNLFVFQIVLSNYHPIFCFLHIVAMFQTREMRPWNHKSPLAVLHHMLETTCTCLSKHHVLFCSE